MNPNPDAATRSMQGLALGDAFGQTWFSRSPEDLAARQPALAPWPWTDDTAMALTLLKMLRDHGEVDQDKLALAFAATHSADPRRGYGPSMHRVLRAVERGEPWRDVTRRQFDGQGSWGNGAAMRVAPLGAWFAHDMDQVVKQAELSAEVTHAHAEAVAGAIAVAAAAAFTVRGLPAVDIIHAVAACTPDSEVASRLRRVAARPFSIEPQWIATEVGSGALISAPDTVPFAIWCAARHLDNLVEALWATVTGSGDLDTTCAIVGGIVGARTGVAAVPTPWLRAREALPAWTGPV